MSVDEAKIINQIITRLLSRREHSRFEILQKLKVKGYAKFECETQLQDFIDRKFQSDSRYAQSYVRTAYIKGKGPQFIRQSLKQHNIDESLVSEYIANEDYNWFDLALHVKVKRFGEKPPIDYLEKQKQMRFLQYRGFEQEHINATFD